MKSSKKEHKNCCNKLGGEIKLDESMLFTSNHLQESAASKRSTKRGTYRYPEHLGLSGSTRKAVPNSRRETTGSDHDDTEEVELMTNVMRCVRVIGEDVIDG